MTIRFARIITLISVLIALAVATALLTACVEIPPEDLPDWLVPDDIETTDVGEVETGGDSTTFEDGLDRHGREMPYGTHGHGTEILMLGRSVMAGWFEHWGWDWEHVVLKEGYAFYYGELDGPPDIDDVAVDYIERVPDTTVVFFKMCFVDFWAGDLSEIEANLAENLGYVEAVVEATERRGMTLILGTALPETIANTTGALVDLHGRYDAALEEIATAHDDVHIFDLHDVLANQQDALYKGFTTTPSDAHLTEVAYFELDEDLFDFLDVILPGE